MAAPTVVVSVNVSDQNGVALENAVVKATLIGTDVYNNELVAQINQEATTDAAGLAQLSLFPNALGTKGTYYRFIVTHPTTGKKITDVTAVVPNAAVNLSQIANNLRANLNLPEHPQAQPKHDMLTSLVSLVSGANKLPYFSGVNSFAVTDFTAAGRSLVGAATLAAASALLPGPFLAADGAVGAPAYSFSAAPAKGFFNPGSSYIALANGAGATSVAIGGGGVHVVSAAEISWTSSATDAYGVGPDVRLFRDAANTLAMRNGVNVQQFNIYGTYTDASNYERGMLTAIPGAVLLQTAGAGTGNSPEVQIRTNGISDVAFYTNSTARWLIAGNGGAFIAVTDNTVDIGASGGNRPKTGYFGTGVIIGAGGGSSRLDLYDNTPGANWVRLRGNVGATTPPIGSGGLFTGWNFSNGDGETHLLFGTAEGGAPTLKIGSWNGSAISEHLRINASSQLLAQNGSAAAPAYSFVSSTNTGFLYSGSNTIGFICGGGLAWQMDGSVLYGKSDGAAVFLGAVSDVQVRRDAANVLAQRNGVNAQAFNIYNTFTDASNYEHGRIFWSGNIFGIGTDKAGTGTARALRFSTGGAYRWEVGTSGHLLAVTDNVYDIGASGATRPRTGYFGTGVHVATGFFDATDTHYFRKTGSFDILRISHSAAGVGVRVASVDPTGSASYEPMFVDGDGVTLQSQTASSVTLGTVGGQQLEVANTAAAVNYLQVTGGAAGNGAALSARGADTNIALSLASKGAGSVIFQTGGGWQAAIGNVAATVNYVVLSGGAAGNAVTLSTQGSDTDVDLALTPKGAGLLRVGTHSAIGAESVTGFITIKDSGGTSRKLAVVS